MFRHIPIQVKVTQGTEQIRAGLPERFGKAAMRAGSASPNLIMERHWVEQGVRYGEMKEIGEEVAQEVDAAYDDERLEALVTAALAAGGEQQVAAAEKRERPTVTLEMFDQPDWQKRYAVLEQMEP
ncbi:virulence factor, partial [Frankia sp. Cpl3]|nr:virulence factor [Frankia sp. Cpl3]